MYGWVEIIINIKSQVTPKVSLDVFQLGEFVREYMKNLVWTSIKKGSMNLYLQILSGQIQVQF